LNQTLGARKWFTIGSLLVVPSTFIINAPFGRFTPQNQSSIFLLDGIKTWIFMELPSPLMFLYTFLTSPLAVAAPAALPSLNQPQAILALCYLIHYLNRAIISPLRTPSRSKSHIIVPMSAILFNIINGGLMGSYLSSPFARTYLAKATPTFYVGLTLWAVGFAGNIMHDEILLNIRRKAKTKGKSKTGAGEHYAIPQGGLYSIISYPNYFCEWLEWLGFALAASPIPFSLAGLSVSSLTSVLLDPNTYVSFVNTPANLWFPSFSPPWVFLLNEVFVMLPRAYRGHLWYKRKFGDAYPKERKAVIPFVF